MAYPAKTVANFFLELAWERGDMIDPMKMQKLIYFAHGWHLSMFESELIDEEIEVWDYGPVIFSVYHEFKKYGMHFIDKLAKLKGSDRQKIKNGSIEEKFLIKIYDIYGKYDSIYLSKLTHIDTAPWTIAKRQNDNIISNELMKNYFSQFVKLKKEKTEV